MVLLTEHNENKKGPPACHLLRAHAGGEESGSRISYGDKGKADDEWPDVGAKKVVAGCRDGSIASRPLIDSPSASVLPKRRGVSDRKRQWAAAVIYMHEAMREDCGLERPVICQRFGSHPCCTESTLHEQKQNPTPTDRDGGLADALTPPYGFIKIVWGKRSRDEERPAPMNGDR
jgi:hypothetical protein